MYPFRYANVPPGVHVPQFGNPWSSTYFPNKIVKFSWVHKTILFLTFHKVAFPSRQEQRFFRLNGAHRENLTVFDAEIVWLAFNTYIPVCTCIL